MIKEDKELLLRDLCVRLSYGVKCKVWYNDKTLDIKCTGIDFYTNTVNLDVPGDDNAKVYVDNIKPYLFPLSSMTEEQKNELQQIIYVETEMICNQLKTNNYGIKNGKYHFNSILQLDWLNKNHFDYRELIEKGLAIDATNLNIY